MITVAHNSQCLEKSAVAEGGRTMSGEARNFPGVTAQPGAAVIMNVFIPVVICLPRIIPSITGSRTPVGVRIISPATFFVVYVTTGSGIGGEPGIVPDHE
jgi:hypothetical protein